MKMRMEVSKRKGGDGERGRMDEEKEAPKEIVRVEEPLLLQCSETKAILEKLERIERKRKRKKDYEARKRSSIRREIRRRRRRRQNGRGERRRRREEATGIERRVSSA